MLDFELEHTSGPAAALHERPIPAPVRPVIWWHDVTAPALVLGSAQHDSDVDLDACDRAGVDVIRRHSGGGAVLLVPGEVVWFDVVVPAGHPAWVADVRASMIWLGRCLRDVIGLGEVHEGPLVSTAWSRTICFDGIGPGEILVDHPGGGRAKLVGISQRRTRDAARFQVCAHTTYDPAALPALLLPEHRPPLDALRPVATLDVLDTDALAATLQVSLSAVAGEIGGEMGANG